MLPPHAAKRQRPGLTGVPRANRQRRPETTAQRGRGGTQAVSSVGTVLSPVMAHLLEIARRPKLTVSQQSVPERPKSAPLPSFRVGNEDRPARSGRSRFPVCVALQVPGLARADSSFFFRRCRMRVRLRRGKRAKAQWGTPRQVFPPSLFQGGTARSQAGVKLLKVLSYVASKRSRRRDLHDLRMGWTSFALGLGFRRSAGLGSRALSHYTASILRLEGGTP